ncbi:MAG: hypothetical protein FJX84_02780 [Bacteroidetes bacterium]|nr:hypothetical protein [Bacteroidota bacterium]
MQIISQKVEINAGPAEIFDFLSNSSNIYQLLPHDKISEFTSTENACSFKVQGGIIISLVQVDRNNEKLLLKSGEKTPFPFDLIIYAQPTKNGSTGFLEFNGDVNPFLKMMMEKPLNALFNFMTNKLKDQFS